MYLNTVKTDGGYTNEVTQILSFLTGKRIVMQKNKKMNVAYTNEEIGIIEIGLTGKVSNILLEEEYKEFLQDISFLFRATHLCHGEPKSSKKDSKKYEKINGFLIMSSEDYVAAAKEGYLNDLLEHHAVHGVVIPQRDSISVTYDYCTQAGYYDGTVAVSNGIVRLVPTNTKPVTKYVKKFTITDAYLCVNDLAYIENVGCIFAPITNSSVCNKLLNVRNGKNEHTEQETPNLHKMSIFGG